MKSIKSDKNVRFLSLVTLQKEKINNMKTKTIDMLTVKLDNANN